MLVTDLCFSHSLLSIIFKLDGGQGDKSLPQIVSLVTPGHVQNMTLMARGSQGRGAPDMWPFPLTTNGYWCLY